MVLRLHILMKGGVLCAVVDVVAEAAVLAVVVEAGVLAVVVDAADKCI